MIWAGGLTDRFRVRTLGPVILGLLAVACVAMAINPFVWALPLVIFALRFTGQGMSSHIAIVAMARWFVATRGRALAIATLGFAIGESFFPLAFVALLDQVSWRWLWVLAAVVALCAIPILMRFLAHERTPQSVGSEDQSAGMAGRHWTRMQALRHPLFWFMVPSVLGPSAFVTAFFFHQVHFAEIKGWTHLQLVAMFPLYTAVGIGAMIGSGWALDRLGTPRLIPYFQLPMVVAFCIFSQAGSVGMALIAFVFLALSTGANTTIPAAFWAEFYGTRHIGGLKALATAVMVLGSAVGPGLTGVLIDLGVSLEAQYLGAAVYFLGASGLMWIGMRRYRRVQAAVVA
jgi:MFS family permease